MFICTSGRPPDTMSFPYVFVIVGARHR